MRFTGISDLLLRLGLAFAFLFPPVNALRDPYSWIGYFPSFVHDMLPNDMIVLHAFGIIEVVIGLWILSGRKIFVPCIVAAVMLIAIVLFNLGDFQILFRDVTIALMALALAAAHRPRKAA